MLAVQVQIKTAFEELGMTVEDIAEDQELEVTAVKACLMQCSSKYRGLCRTEDKEAALNFTDEQLADANRTIHDLMMGAEDEGVRLKAAMYLRDDKRGRKEVVKGVGGMQFNILQFNETLKRVRNEIAAEGDAINV